jgi:hypothetical protein
VAGWAVVTSPPNAANSVPGRLGAAAGHDRSCYDADHVWSSLKKAASIFVFESGSKVALKL